MAARISHKFASIWELFEANVEALTRNEVVACTFVW